MTSINKLAKAQRVPCEAGIMLSCIEPFTDRIETQESDVEGTAGIYDQLDPIAKAVMAARDYDACVMAGEARTRKLLELGKRASESRRRRDLTNEFFDAINRSTTPVMVQCPKPDVETCGIRLLPKPPVTPNRAVARRRLNTRPAAGGVQAND